MLEFSENFSRQLTIKVYFLIFSSLSSTTKLSDVGFACIERFVVFLYDAKSSHSSVNECYRYLFTKKERAVESIPVTNDALQQHIKRVMLQIKYAVINPRLANVQSNKNFVSELYGVVYTILFLAKFVTQIGIKMKKSFAAIIITSRAKALQDTSLNKQ